MTRRPIPTVTSMSALTLLAGLATGCPDNPDGGATRKPFRDDWRTVIDQDFIHLDADGTPQISRVTFGSREYNDNFANRGDVIVNFDGPANHIMVEFRRFTFSPTQDGAQNDFDALSVWAFAGVSNPKPPGDKDLEEEDDCIISGWQNDCEVLVYYDGLSQLRRSGVDMRITLPADYRQRIDIITEDNVEDDDYFNRGNVCIGNLFATADVELESGNVWVDFNRDVYPAPKCTPQQIADCESFMIDDGMGGMVPAPWAPECPCFAQGSGEFGILSVDNRAETASDITVDVPSTLWTSIVAQNKGSGQEAAGEHCEAVVSVPGAVADDTGNDFPWQAKYTTNYPGPPAIEGAGFNIQVSSNACSPVATTEDPADFVGVGKGDEQESTERGNIEVCTDCIVQTCAELIP